MKYYLKDIIPRLKKYSASLDQSSFLVDKPWVVANNTEKYQKLIFRRDGRVHISYQGDVKDGSWEYLPEAECLIIDYGDHKKLYRHQYLDEAVLALVNDGKNVEKNYFLLANEQKLPNLDVKLYLKNKYLSKKSIDGFKLQDGNHFSVNYNSDQNQKVYDNNGNLVKDGIYTADNAAKKIVIKNGSLYEILEKYIYDDIIIWQKYLHPSRNDLVEGITDGKFEIITKDNTEYSVIVENRYIKQIKNSTHSRVTKMAIMLMAFFLILIILAIIFQG